MEGESNNSEAKKLLELPPPKPSFPYGPVAQAYLIVCGWMEERRKSISTFLVSQVLRRLGYSTGDIYASRKLIVGNWVVPLGLQSKQWWRLSKGGATVFARWQEHAELGHPGLCDRLERRLQGIVSEEETRWGERHPYLSIRQKKHAQRVGTTLLIHYDPGDRDRLLDYLREIVPEVRSVVVTYWNRYDRSEVERDEVIRIAESKSTDGLHLIPVDLEAFPSTVDLEKWVSEGLREEDLPDGLSTHVSELARVISEETREYLIIQMATFPRQILFLVYFLLNLASTPYGQKWEYTEAAEHVLKDPKAGARLVTRSMNDRNGGTFLFFLEQPTIRVKSLDLEKIGSDYERVVCGIPPGSLEENGQQKLLLFEELDINLPRATRLTKINTTTVDSALRDIERINPDAILVSGSRLTCIAVFRYFMERLRSGGPVPVLTFAHVYSPIYTKGATVNSTVISMPPAGSVGYA